MKYNVLAALVSILACLVCLLSEARPEYALLNNYVSCNVCHVSPVGGGIRNLQGKLFGGHSKKTSKITQKVDWLQVDFRTEAFQAKNSATRKGLLVMTTTPSVNVPVNFDDESGTPPMSFVLSYGLGRLDVGLSESYLLTKLNAESDYSWFDNLLVGRFLPPFGLATDEHRTFTRMATLSTNRDFETGFMLSGTPNYYFHYDFALTNGLQGDSPVADDAPWGAFFAARSIPKLGPVMLGTSYSRHGTQKVRVQPEALDLYALWSLEKSYGKLPLTLIGEVTWAYGWNNSLINTGGTGGINNFIPTTETAWQAGVNESKSQASLLSAQWTMNPSWVWIYRMEQFTPDVNFTADSFYRYGYGAKWFVNGQMNLQARYETAFSTRPGITEAGVVRAVGEAYYLLLHFWL